MEGKKCHKRTERGIVGFLLGLGLRSYVSLLGDIARIIQIAWIFGIFTSLRPPSNNNVNDHPIAALTNVSQFFSYFQSSFSIYVQLTPLMLFSFSEYNLIENQPRNQSSCFLLLLQFVSFLSARVFRVLGSKFWVDPIFSSQQKSYFLPQHCSTLSGHGASYLPPFKLKTYPPES